MNTTEKNIINKIKVIDKTDGEGNPSDRNTLAHVNITAYDENGKLFYQNNPAHPLRVPVCDTSYPPGIGYMRGLVYGLLGIKRYQKRTIIFPPELGYNIPKDKRGKEDVPLNGPGGLDLDSYIVMELDCVYIEEKRDSWWNDLWLYRRLD